MNTNTMLTIFAMVLALGLVAVFAVESVSVAQEADAQGCRTSTAFNASQGRCFEPGGGGGCPPGPAINASQGRCFNP
jgi:uncharacterized low-complexity protein